MSVKERVVKIRTILKERKRINFVDLFDDFSKPYVNQFGASAYDCVYALYGAMKKAMDEGTKIPVTISASDLCEILKAQFNGGYTLENAVTGESISWESNGYVNKIAIQYFMK